MTDVDFRVNVFDKINDTYKLLKPVKDLSPHGNDEAWAKWVNDCEAYCKEIKDPLLQSAVSRFLIDMGDYISKCNRQKAKG